MVSCRYPDVWRRLRPPLLASRRWHQAMAGRIEGEPVWFTLGAGPDFGISGYVVTERDAYRYGNLGALLADPASPFAAADLAQRLSALDRASLYPHLLLTYPGYSTFPLGAGAERAGLAAVVEWAREQGLAALGLPYTESTSALAGAAAELGFHPCPTSTDAYLPVPAGGFAEYAAGLSAKRRTTVRAERKAVHASGLRDRHVTHVTRELVDRMAFLRAKNRRKYGLPADLDAERERIARVVEVLGVEVDLIVVDDGTGGPAVCFTLFVRDHETWHGLYVGVDYDDPRSGGTYFEASFYAALDHAPARGVRQISYGMGSDEAKRLRGCVLVPLTSFLLGMTPAAETTARRAGELWREAAR